MLSYEYFSQVMTFLCEIYNRQQTEPLMQGYYMVLKHMDDEDFKAATMSIMANRTYQSMPKPAEILEYVRPDVEAIATLATAEIENAISKYGAYRSISFEDIVLNSVVDHLGGWLAICQMDMHDWKFAKKEIPKLYGIYARRKRHPTHLVGIAERDNGGTKQIETVKAGYVLPNIRTIDALNPPDLKSKDIAKKLTLLANSKSVYKKRT